MPEKSGRRGPEAPEGELGMKEYDRILPASRSASHFLDRAVSRLRWAILATALLITLTWPISSRTGHPIWAYLAVFIAYNLLVEFLRGHLSDTRYRAWLPVLDLLVAAALYYFDAEPGGPLFVLFYLAVVSAAASMPLRGALLYTAATVVVVMLIAPTLPLWAFTTPYLRQFATRLVVLSLVGIGTAFLIQRLAAEQEATQAARDEAERLAERLRHQLDFQRAIDNSTVEGLYALDREGRVTYVNPAAEQLLGWTAAELLGRAMHDVIHYRRPDGTPYPREECSGLRVLQTGAPYRTEDEAFIRKDGALFPVAYSSAPIVEADGRVAGLVVAFADITERKRAEEALRASEATLRLVTSQVPAHIWTTDTDLRVTSVLGTGMAQVGIDAGVYVGKTLHELRGLEHPVTVAHLRALAGEPAGYEVRLGERDFEARVEPLQDAEGRITGCLGLALDVTARKWAERRRSAEYEVTRALAECPNLGDAAPRILRAIGDCLEWDYGALWTVDRRQGVLRCADTWHTAGTEFAEFVAASRWTTFAPGVGLPGRVWAGDELLWIADTAGDPNFPRLRVAAAEGLRAGFGVPIRLDGQVVGVLEFLSRRVREPDQESLAMLAALGSQIGQFSERKRAEEALEARARQQAAVAELGQRALATPDLDAVLDQTVAVVARTLDVEYCKVLELLPDGDALLLRAGVGWRAGTVGQATVPAGRDSQAGYTLLSDEPVVVEDVAAETRFAFPPLVREHGVVSAMSVVIPGRERPFGVLQADSARRRSFTGDDAYFLQAVANVLAAAIERRAFEQQLAREEAVAQASRDEAARLAELDRLRREFVAAVSHELRTPLGSARVGLGMLESGLDDRLGPEEREVFGTVRRNLERLTMNVNDLLTVNQLEAGVLQLRPQPVDLRAIIADAIAALHPLIGAKDQVLEVDLPEPLPVVGDPQRLEQLALNLVANAHYHTPAGTRIAVTGRTAGAEVRVAVRDSGPGLPPEVLGRVFERFHRVAPAAGGTGLGLAIAKALTELHGGRIWAESRPGRGTAFHVALPAAPGGGEVEGVA